MEAESVLSNVSNSAVWGSLIGALLLANYMLVQVFIDAERRWRYLLFAMLCWTTAVVDFLRPSLTPLQYEHYRILIWSAYPLTLFYLFGYRMLWGVAAMVVLLLAALVCPLLGWESLQSSVVVAPAFFLVAVVHWREFRLHCGYASSVLMTTSGCLGLMCSLYYPVVATNNFLVIALGYAHYAMVTLASVLLGWIQLPRELRGFAPVRVPYRFGMTFCIAVVGCEAFIQQQLLAVQVIVPPQLLGLAVLQGSLVLLYYLFHRHQLVIYAANVTELLEQRTRSLAEAREALAQINQQQAELLSEQAQELTSKSAVIERQRRLELAGQTAGQAAHDIQNLLVPLVSAVDDLKQCREGSPNLTGVVDQIGKRLGNLVSVNSQLLSLARRGRVEAVPIGVTELLHDVVERFPTGSVSLNVEPGLWIEGSATQLDRVVSNLVSNAVEASARSGTQVTVGARSVAVEAVRRCHLGFLRPGEFVAIEVADRGVGIPEEHLDRIFEPFFSSKSAVKGSGCGLGLSIVATVIEDHRGVLDLSTGTDGTTFTVYLSRRANPAKSAGDLPRRQITVLLVEDHLTARSEIESALTRAGHRVVIAENGTAAIRHAYRTPFDVVIAAENLRERSTEEVLFAVLHLQPKIRMIALVEARERLCAARFQTLGAVQLIPYDSAQLDVLNEVASIISNAPEIADSPKHRRRAR